MCKEGSCYGMNIFSLEFAMFEMKVFNKQLKI